MSKFHSPRNVRNKYFLIFVFLFLIALGGFLNNNLAAINENQNTYKVEYSAPNSSDLSNEARDSLELYMNQNWEGEIPKDNLFYLPSLRYEGNWALANMYFLPDVQQGDLEDDSLMNMFLVLIVNVGGSWHSASSEDVEARDLLLNIPDEELSYQAKSTLFKHFPTSIKPVNESILYKFPWPSDGKKFHLSSIRSNTANDCPDDSPWHGSYAVWGTEACRGIDFAAKGVFLENEQRWDYSEKILSPVNGFVKSICKNSNGKQSVIAIQATNSEQVVGLWHLNQDSIPVSIMQGTEVTIGEYLGYMVDGFVNETNKSVYACPLLSQGTHLHMVMPRIPVSIDGYNFMETVKGVNKGPETWKFSDFLGKDIISTNGIEDICKPSSSGDWVISESCELSRSQRVNGNIIINPGKILTIPNNFRINIDLKRFKINVNNGGGLLLKDGASIQN